RIAEARVSLARRGLHIAVWAGAGPWIQLAGAVAILVGGLLASRLPAVDEPPTRPRDPWPRAPWAAPPRPDPVPSPSVPAMTPGDPPAQPTKRFRVAVVPIA